MWAYCISLCSLTQVHGDLKPANVLLLRDAADPTSSLPVVRVADFGLCGVSGHNGANGGAEVRPFVRWFVLCMCRRAWASLPLGDGNCLLPQPACCFT